MHETMFAQSLSFGMGTEITHRAFGQHAEKALKAVNDEAIRLEKRLSRFVSESEISKINNAAGRKCEKISADTYGLLSRIAQLSSGCQGLFDVTVGPLVDLWDYKHASEIPDAARIRQVLPLVNYADLILEPYEKTAGLQKLGQSIDLGSIGKGYASDKFLEVFKKYGVTSAFTNIGGNVAALGTKPDGSPWCVGIRHPRQQNRLIGAVSVADRAVVTSGDDQRYFVDSKGKRYHHILDPRTGYPAESGLASVTVIADSTTLADVLSTILFIAGIKKGVAFLKNFPEAEAIFVDTGLCIYVTQGLKDSFQAEIDIKPTILES